MKKLKRRLRKLKRKGRLRSKMEATKLTTNEVGRLELECSEDLGCLTEGDILHVELEGWIHGKRETEDKKYAGDMVVMSTVEHDDQQFVNLLGRRIDNGHLVYAQRASINNLYYEDGTVHSSGFDFKFNEVDPGHTYHSHDGISLQEHYGL